MAEHIITLADHEARRLATTGTLLIVRPVVPQLPWWATSPTLRSDGYWVWGDEWQTETYWRESVHLAPWLRGDVLLCKEAVWIHKDIDVKRPPKNPGVYYEDQVMAFQKEPGRWLPAWYRKVPASTMPLWAIRFHAVVKEVGVMRVKDLGGRQAIDAGMLVPAHMPQDGADYDWARREFAAYWNRRFRKYPWENNPWCWIARVERGKP